MTTRTGLRKRFLAYLRVSSKKQVDEGYSMGEQREAIEKWCREQGAEDGDIEWFIDEGISGRRLNRPEFNRMLEKIEAGEPNEGDVVVAWRLDRFSRRETTGFRLKEALEGAGMEIHSITQGAITGRLMFGMWLLMAAQESEDKSVRARMGAMARAKNGKIVFKARYGYRMSHKTGLPIVHTREAEVVKRIFREYVDGVQPCDILDGLNRDGIRTQGNKLIDGKLWAYNDLNRVLKTTEYYGVGYYGRRRYKYDTNDQKHTVWRDREDWIEIAFPVLVDKVTWDAAQRIQKKKVHLKLNKTDFSKFPLHGLLWCSTCGARFLAHRATRTKRVRLEDGSIKYVKKDQKQRVYRCRIGCREKTDCVRKVVSASKLEATIWDELRKVLEHPLILTDLIAERRRQYEETGSHVEIDAQRRNLGLVDGERQRLMTMFQKGYLSNQDLDIRMRGIIERREMLDSELSRLVAEAKDYDQYVSMLDSFIESAAHITQRLDEISEKERGEIMAAMVERVDIGEEIEIHVVPQLPASLKETTTCRQ